VAYLIEENRILRGHVRGRIRLTDEERRRLARHGHRLRRRRLRAVATIVTPDTILRWHWQLIARKWTLREAARRSSGRPRGDRRLSSACGGESDVGLHADRWRAEECRSAGEPVDDRADLEGLGHSARTRTVDILVDVSAGALGRDRRGGFLYDEVWTWRGLVTYYTVFVIDLASRRVQIVGLTPHPDEAFMRQVDRTLTTADQGNLVVIAC
jgi:putative transposase